MESSVENTCTDIRVSYDKVFHSPNTRACDLLTSSLWKVTLRFLTCTWNFLIGHMQITMYTVQSHR